MAIGAAAVAWIGVGVAAVGVAVSYTQQRKAQRAQERAAYEQKKSNAVMSAQQAQQAAAERRQQIREERIKRATILQQAEDSGVSGGSGEMGAIGGMATQLGSNLGSNGSALLAGQQISGYQQSAANFMQAAQTAQGKAQTWNQVASMGGSMFSQAGGWNTLFGSMSKKA